MRKSANVEKRRCLVAHAALKANLNGAEDGYRARLATALHCVPSRRSSPQSLTRCDLGASPVFATRASRNPICDQLGSRKMEDRHHLPARRRPGTPRRAAPSIPGGVQEDADPTSPPDGTGWTHRSQRSERKNTPRRVFLVQLARASGCLSDRFLGPVGCAAYGADGYLGYSRN